MSLIEESPIKLKRQGAPLVENDSEIHRFQEKHF